MQNLFSLIYSCLVGEVVGLKIMNHAIAEGGKTIPV
jgi:hypothetical protein